MLSNVDDENPSKSLTNLMNNFHIVGCLIRWVSLSTRLEFRVVLFEAYSRICICMYFQTQYYKGVKKSKSNTAHATLIANERKKLKSKLRILLLGISLFSNSIFVCINFGGIDVNRINMVHNFANASNLLQYSSIQMVHGEWKAKTFCKLDAKHQHHRYGIQHSATTKRRSRTKFRFFQIVSWYVKQDTRKIDYFGTGKGLTKKIHVLYNV